ncbi:MAG: hypothetical protein KAJ62_05440 [Desulfobacteraceae bacterium]|nr:hypothetical protein [Desulfobacteraceae bacterium]
MTNSILNNIIMIFTYFFTPEDSATPIWHGSSSYNIEYDIKGIGATKALFWVGISMLFVYLISLL